MPLRWKKVQVRHCPAPPSEVSGAVAMSVSRVRRPQIRGRGGGGGNLAEKENSSSLTEAVSGFPVVKKSRVECTVSRL